MSIKVNVQGTIFETTIDTIKKINYFKYVIEATNFDFNEILFVNRPAHIFKHVLALVTTNNYKYPLKYKEELDFYDVVYDVNCLYEPNKEIDHVKGDIKYLIESVDLLEVCSAQILYSLSSSAAFTVCVNCHKGIKKDKCKLCRKCANSKK